MRQQPAAHVLPAIFGAARAGRDPLVGIEQPGRIEGALDREERVALLRRELYAHRIELLDADAATHRSLDAQLQRQFDADPSDTNKMRLALALTTPGHSRADMLKGQQLIQQLQSKQEALPPVISIYLRTRVTATRQTNALEDKVKTLATDNKDLNDQLEDVRAQIKALTAIEKNLEKANPK